MPNRTRVKQSGVPARDAAPDRDCQQLNQARNDSLVRRLKRIEGQARGVQRMIEQGRSCPDVLCQLSAMNEAIRGVSLLVAKTYALECLEGGPGDGPQERVTALLDALMRAPR